MCRISHVLLSASVMIFSMFPRFAAAQNGSWQSYSNGNSIRDIAIHENTIWCATDGGVVRWDISDMSSTLFSVDDGLLDNNMTCIAVDSIGTVWAGTEYGGISSYDGSQWNTYGSNEGLSAVTIMDITVSPDNHVYAASRGSVYRYDGTEWHNIPSDVSLSSCYCIAVTAEDDIWIGQSEGVKYYSNSVWHSYPMADYMENPAVRSIFVDGDDVWAASFIGLARYHDDQWVSYAGSGVASLDVVDITQGPDGSIWFATKPYIGSGGFSCFDGNEWHNYYFSTNRITSIAVDSNNAIWGGNFLDTGAVLFQYSTQDQQFQYYRESTDRAALDNAVKSVIQTTGGDILATTLSGLSRLHDGEWSVVFDDESGGVMARSPGGDIYIGGDIEGLYRLSGDERIPVEGFTGMYITRMAFADETDYWVGTSHSPATDGGLYHYDNGTWTEYHEQDGLPDGTISALVVDTDGSVWVGTHGGLARYADGVWQTYTADDLGIFGRDSYIPTSLAIDASGTLYVGTHYGLYTMTGGQFTKCFDEEVVTLHKDELGRIWVARQKYTSHGSIHCFGIYTGTDDYTEYTIPYAPLRTQINCMYYDSQNNTMWVGTDYMGLFSLDLDGVESVEEPESQIAGFSLGDNYPNPFNMSTTIPYTLTGDNPVEIVIYNITGQAIRSFRENMSAGYHAYVWDGKDTSGNVVPSGVYVYSLRIKGAMQSSRKMLLIK